MDAYVGTRTLRLSGQLRALDGGATSPRRGVVPGARRVAAAIDIGSNSVHMVVGAAEGGSLRLLGRAKEIVRLGEGMAPGSLLPAPAVARALAALKWQKALAAAQGAQHLVAVATSAVRDAADGAEFLERVSREVGLRGARAISGEEEGRLVYRAARHSLHFGGRRALVMDAGGGSVELALGQGAEPDWIASERLGVLRLAGQFAQHDLLSRADVRRLADHAGALLEPHLDRALRDGAGILVGTSGTLLALGRLALGARPPWRLRGLHHVAVEARALREVAQRLSRSTLEERRRLPGLDPRRAEVIAVGAVLLEVVLDRLRPAEVLLCEWALREGLLLDHLESHPPAADDHEVRRRSVAALSRRSWCDEAHARRVARLALRLFDATRCRHRLPASDRALLESAALLHEAGRGLAGPGSHKRTRRVILGAGLHGFSPLDLEVTALVARYHRGRRPRRRHASYRRLPRARRRAVRVLSGILRIAHALDAGRRRAVRSLSAVERDRTLVVRVHAADACVEELGRAARRRRLLERVLRLPLRLERADRSVPAAVFGAGAHGEEEEQER